MKGESTKKPNPDEDLVARAQEGDLEAMDELVSQHHGIVFRVAFRMLGDEDAAADVAQETFLKAFRGLERFRGESSFKTWLLTIAANEARGALRKSGRRNEVALEAVTPAPSPEPAADEALGTKEDVSRVMQLISRLPEKQKQAVTLRILEELSFREIGDIIGSSEGAARVNYHHGIRRLREMLA